MIMFMMRKIIERTFDVVIAYWLNTTRLFLGLAYLLQFYEEKANWGPTYNYILLSSSKSSSKSPAKLKSVHKPAQIEKAVFTTAPSPAVGLVCSSFKTQEWLFQKIIIFYYLLLFQWLETNFNVINGQMKKHDDCILAQ